MLELILDSVQELMCVSKRVMVISVPQPPNVAMVKEIAIVTPNARLDCAVATMLVASLDGPLPLMCVSRMVMLIIVVQETAALMVKEIAIPMLIALPDMCANTMLVQSLDLVLLLMFASRLKKNNNLNK